MIALWLACAPSMNAPPEVGVPVVDAVEEAQPAPMPPLRMGYFHGGRNTLLYRAMDDGAYERAGVDVVFRATRDPHNPVFFDLPRNVVELETEKELEVARWFGRTTGPQIIDEMKAGGLDCGMIGESSFLTVVDEGLPWQAVAMLGQDQNDEPGKVVVIRDDLPYDGPQSLVGRNIGSRQSGPYDMVMTREFVLGQGLALTDMTILDQITPDVLNEQLENGTLDLAFLHLHIAAKAVEFWDYRLLDGFTFDFAEPALSQALLVCTETVIAERREELIRFLTAYKRRIDYEHSLPARVRLRFSDEKGLGMDHHYFEGFNIPQYVAEPIIHVPLLDEMQALMVKHGILETARPVAPHVTNDLITEALDRVAAEGSMEYPVEPFVVLEGTAAERLLQIIDVDGDGRVSMDEYRATAARQPLMRESDLNHDRYLNVREIRRMLRTQSPLLENHRGKGRVDTPEDLTEMVVAEESVDMVEMVQKLKDRQEEEE